LPPVVGFIGGDHEAPLPLRLDCLFYFIHTW
jgi:hypothetical protein